MSVFLFTQAYFIYSVPILVGLLLCTIESLFLLRGKSFFGLLDMPQQFGRPEITPYHFVPHTLRLYEVTIVFWFMVFSRNDQSTKHAVSTIKQGLETLHEVAQSVEETKTSMSEIASGSKQIISAVDKLSRH